MQTYYYVLSGNVFDNLRHAPVFQQGLVIAGLSLISVFAVLFTFYLAVRFLGNVKKPTKATLAGTGGSDTVASIQTEETAAALSAGNEEAGAEGYELMETDMLRTFKVKVNNKVYDVEIEDSGYSDGTLGASATAPVPAATPAPSAISAPADKLPATEANEETPVPVYGSTSMAAPAAPVTGGSKPVYAPMPGTVIALKKAVGEPVAAHETVLVLEAMKMENEIVAPQAGKIASIHVRNGQQVEASSVLFTIV